MKAKMEVTTCYYSIFFQGVWWNWKKTLIVQKKVRMI